LPIVLLRYEDGTVAGYNYVTSELLFSTASPVQTFLSFGLRQMKTMLSGFFSFGSGRGEETEAEIPETTAPSATEAPTAPTAQPGDGGPGAPVIVPGGSNTEGGSGMGPVTPEATVPETTAPEETTPAETEPEATVPVTEPGQPEDPAGTEATAPGTAGETTHPDSGETGSSDSGDAAAPGASEEAGSSGSSGQIVVAGTAIPDSGSYYVEDSGVYTDGQLVLSDEEAQYRPGEGVYSDGQLVYAESLIPSQTSPSTPETGTSGSTDDPEAENITVVEVVTPQVQAQQLATILGSSTMAYNPESGKYEPTDGTVVLSLPPQTQPENPTEPEATAPTLPQQTEPDKNQFVVNQSDKVVLTDSDQNGILFLVLFATAGSFILIALYFKAVRKKR